MLYYIQNYHQNYKNMEEIKLEYETIRGNKWTFEFSWLLIKLKEREKVNKSILTNSLKSSAVLMIYNLIEYTVFEAIECIESDFKSYDIKDFKIKFQSLFYKAFGLFLNDVKFKNILNILEKDAVWLDSIIEKGYFYENMKLNDKCKIKVENKQGQSNWIKWNINCRAIKTLSKLFEFNLKETRKINTTQNDLLNEIKTKRNNLSHGSTSFNHIWKDISVQQLRNYINELKDFFDNFLEEIEKYVKNKPYLQIVR